MTLAGSKRPYFPEELPPSTPYKNSRPRSAQPSPLPAVANKETTSGSGDGSPLTAWPTFRNVSACNRCRLRKNRCDQRLPQCQSCEKAGVHCVGYDPTTKREIPRSYTFFLESRVAYLEGQLRDHNVAFRPAQPYEGEKGLGNPRGAADNEEAAVTDDQGKDVEPKVEADQDDAKPTLGSDSERDDYRKQSDSGRDRGLDSLVSNISMVPVQGTSDPRYLGSTSGISFARVFFAALRSSVLATGSVSERGSTRPGERRPSSMAAASNNGGSSMRDSFFGLQTRPTMQQAPFPSKELAGRLINLYFEHANPQIPILHRGLFMERFERIYSDEKSRTPPDMYMLNIVCAIGAGIIFDTKSDNESQNQDAQESSSGKGHTSNHQCQPEEYHASAVVHLESFLCSSSSSDASNAGLEELQAVLLLASFAVLRPVAPGLWYIAGVAVRLAIDLGLHSEDGTEIDTTDDDNASHQKGAQDDTRKPSTSLRRVSVDPRERGRREWIRDFRRRLFWCVYTFDRLVSTCVGRPFGITDEVITTEFPSLLDDKYITKTGFLEPPSRDTQSYKHVAHHYFKLRLLQSEIQQVLQYQHAKLARLAKGTQPNSYFHKDVSSPFLSGFGSFYAWRRDVHRRLVHWKDSAPTDDQTGVEFHIEFLELNYWQAIIMLYRQSVAVPEPLANEVNPTEDLSSPKLASDRESEDEEEIYLKVAEAGQKVLRLYRKLHCVRLVNYTYLATHHLFMAGVSFLYAIWHSPLVRERLTFVDVDFTVYSAISVLGDLMEKCPPAEACRDAFDRMSKATIKMCLSTTGFGTTADKLESRRTSSRVEEEAILKRPDTQSGDLQANQDPAPTLITQVEAAGPSHQDITAQRSDKNPWQPRAGIGTQSEPHYDMAYATQSPEENQQYTATQPQLLGPNNNILSPSQSPGYNSYVLSQQQSNVNRPTFTNPFATNTGDHQQQQQQQLQLQQKQEPTSQPPIPSQFDQSLSELTGLDFLEYPGSYPPRQPSVYGTMPVNPDGMYGTDPNFIPPTSIYDPALPNGTGLDLRFGMGSDFQNDWNDGGGIDLFDGYFFGSGGGFHNGNGV